MSESTPDSGRISEDEAYARAVDENGMEPMDEAQETQRRIQTDEDF